MESKEYHSVDKSEWLPGVWKDEPDKAQWQDAVTGLPCLVVRGPHGSWCGYVGVLEAHPLYGKDYDTLDVSVHGGLTFSDKCAPSEKEERGICHVPSPGESDQVWWFGFDCAHAGDISPGYAHHLHGSAFKYGEYRDIRYVKDEVANLARQLKALA